MHSTKRNAAAEARSVSETGQLAQAIGAQRSTGSGLAHARGGRNARTTLSIRAAGAMCRDCSTAENEDP
jgi:hypothetical protein